MVTITSTADGIKYVNGSLTGELEFHVKQFSDMLDDSEYGCCFLASQYFTAESDFFKVNLKRDDGSKEVLGWMFHINLLSEDAAFYDGMDEFLLKYMHVGLHKLVEYSINQGLIKDESGTLKDLSLSDDLIILVYRLSIINEVNIANLFPSLYDNGFVATEEPDKVSSANLRVNDYQKERIDDFKSDPTRTCINLCLVAPVFNNSLFVKSLFMTYLPAIDDDYLRYLMLYQIIEILMSVEYGNRYYEFVEKYGNDKRHNLMEKFGELSSEAKLIGKIYEIGATSTFHLDFNASAQQLLDKVDEGDFKDSPTFQDYMYKIRNMVVHNLSLMRDYPKEMNRIADVYEIAIADLIHRTAIEVKRDKKLFVIDMNKSYEEIKGMLYGAYHS